MLQWKHLKGQKIQSLTSSHLHPLDLLTLKATDLIEEEITLGGEFVLEDPASGWSSGLHLVTVCGVRSFLGSEPQNFECFAGEDSEIIDDHVEPAQL